MPNESARDDLAVKVTALSKTFYTGFFAPIPIIRRRQFGKLHRVVHAVSQVNFEIPRGQIFALLGANGAGKSTTMKVLMGLIKSTQGHAEIFGVNVRRAQSRDHVGYLPENPSFYDELTPTELMRLFCEMHGIARYDVQRHSAELLARVGMSYAADRPLRKLSKGMHQRVGIAQALIGAPSLLVLDEPFSGLDPIGRREIREVLLEERARGATILFSSHILPDVEALCDSFLVLELGKVRYQGDLSELSLGESEVELQLARASDLLIEALGQIEGCNHQKQNTSGRGLQSFHLPNRHVNSALSLICEYQGEIYAMQRVRPPLESLFIPESQPSKEIMIQDTQDVILQDHSSEEHS